MSLRLIKDGEVAEVDSVNPLVLPEIFQVPYWEVDSVWPRVAPMLQKAIDIQDEWTLEAVYRKLVNSDDTMPFQLWVIPWTGAIITQVQVFPTGIRKCLLFLAGGSSLDQSLHTHAKIEEWARKFRGCSTMTIYGRRGWVKVLDGYKERTVILEKGL